jgi:hypothetical protein
LKTIKTVGKKNAFCWIRELKKDGHLPLPIIISPSGCYETLFFVWARPEA